MAVTHINVVADNDELTVTWRGGSPSLSVFVSNDPDDPGTDVRAPNGAGRAVIARSKDRQYIHLFEPEGGFSVAAQHCLDTARHLTSAGDCSILRRIFGWFTGLERAAEITGRRGFLSPKLAAGPRHTSLWHSVVPFAPDPTNFRSISRAPVAALRFRSLATQEHW